jgi:peptidoglycan/xylan/chitin deacetylase (PgdA/CDA1 family)
MTVQNEYIILLFHSVDDRDLLSLRDLGNIRPEVFDTAIAALKKEFDIISLEDAVGCISGEGRGPGRPLSITFDDGSMSYLSHAVPILESHGVPSTCFLITDCVDDRTIYWRYLYNYCVQAGLGGQLEELIKEEYKVPSAEGGIIHSTRNNFSKEGTERVIEKIMGSMVSEKEYREREGRLFLSSGDIEGLKGNPLVNFGIHTRSHPVMMGLSDEEIRDEISDSFDFYGREIGGGVPMFSIPFGRLYRDYDERTIDIARGLSVEVILSAYGGGNSEGQPLYNIRRIPVQEDMLKEGVRSFMAHLMKQSAADGYAEKEARLRAAVGAHSPRPRTRS